MAGYVVHYPNTPNRSNTGLIIYARAYCKVMKQLIYSNRCNNTNVHFIYVDIRKVRDEI